MPPVGARPVRLALDDDPVDAASPWLQHKTTRRDVYLTRALRHPEADDVVLVNQHGELTETTTANLAVRARRPVVDAAHHVRLPARGSSAPGCWSRAACTSAS